MANYNAEQTHKYTDNHSYIDTLVLLFYGIERK